MALYRLGLGRRANGWCIWEVSFPYDTIEQAMTAFQAFIPRTGMRTTRAYYLKKLSEDGRYEYIMRDVSNGYEWIWKETFEHMVK